MKVFGKQEGWGRDPDPGFEKMRSEWGGKMSAIALRGKSLSHLIAEDEVVAKRGKPSLPKLKFMEGPGPERYDEQRQG